MTPRLLPKDAREAQRVIEMRQRVAHRRAVQQRKDAERRKQRAIFESAFRYKAPEDDEYDAKYEDN